MTRYLQARIKNDFARSKADAFWQAALRKLDIFCIFKMLHFQIGRRQPEAGMDYM